MATPDSGTAAYATTADLLTRYDARLVADLVLDTGTRPDPATLGNNAVLLALLREASGILEAAVCVAARYSPADLAALQAYNGGASNSNQMLVGVVCGLAMWLLFDRRPEFVAERQLTLPNKAQWALEQVDRLEKGDRIFGQVEAEQAGLPADTADQEIDVLNRNLATSLCRPYFGRRSNQFPGGGPPGRA